MHHVARPPLPPSGFNTIGKPTSSTNRLASVPLVINWSRAVLMPACCKHSFQPGLVERTADRSDAQAPEAERLRCTRYRREQRFLRRDDLMQRALPFGEHSRGGDQLVRVVNVVDAGKVRERIRPVGVWRLFANTEQANAIEALDRPRTTQTFSARSTGDVDDSTHWPLVRAAHAVGASLAAARRRASSWASRACRS